MVQISSRGWRKEEPGDAEIPQEQPRMFPKMVEIVYGNPIDWQQLKRDTGGVPTPLLKTLLGKISFDDPGSDHKVLSFQKRVA
jgi:hypothetical protein